MDMFNFKQVFLQLPVAGAVAGASVTSSVYGGGGGRVWDRIMRSWFMWWNKRIFKKKLTCLARQVFYLRSHPFPAFSLSSTLLLCLLLLLVREPGGLNFLILDLMSTLSSNTQAPTMMIAERTADWILEERRAEQASVDLENEDYSNKDELWISKTCFLSQKNTIGDGGSTAL